MSQSEINEVVASVEALIRRAYALGRRDAMRQLVKYAESDESIAKPLALLAPVVEAQTVPPDGAPQSSANDAGPAIPVGDGSKPRMSRFGLDETRQASSQPSGGLTAMILDFVYPPKAS